MEKRPASSLKRRLRSFSRAFLAFFFLVAGANHFLHPAYYLAIMPAYIPFPFHKAAVILSGIAEMGLGLLALFPRFRGPARWGLLALLLAIFPANVQMALHPELYPFVSAAMLWARLPLQFLLMAWVWWSVPPEPEKRLGN